MILEEINPSEEYLIEAKTLRITAPIPNPEFGAAFRFAHLNRLLILPKQENHEDYIYHPFILNMI